MYLLIGLSKFAQTFAVRFLKSSFIHPIWINALGNFSFKLDIFGHHGNLCMQIEICIFMKNNGFHFCYGGGGEASCCVIDLIRSLILIWNFF